MKRSIFFLLTILICSTSISSCLSNQRQHFSNDAVAKIGTFNIEWLGDGVRDTKPRTEEEYKLVADAIASTDLELIGLQEIENIDALNRVLKYLPEFKGLVLEKSGNQNLGFIYKNTVSIDTFYYYSPIAIDPSRNRPGLVVHARKGNFDWIMMVVHFKASSKFDDTEEKRMRSLETRMKQAEILSNWIDSVLANSTEQDLIIVGDFNDNPTRSQSALVPLITNKNIRFLTENERSCKNEKWDNIDHIVVSSSAKNRVFIESLIIENHYYKYDEQIAKQISDHCPVGIAFDIVLPDND